MGDEPVEESTPAPAGPSPSPETSQTRTEAALTPGNAEGGSAPTAGDSGATAPPKSPPAAAGGNDCSGDHREDVPKTRAENLKVIGGLVALCAGLAALVLLAGAALFHLKDEYATSAVTAAISSMATMVGAYFGIKVGTDGTKEAQENTKEAIGAQKKASTEATGIALAIHPDDMSKALEAIKQLQ